MRRWNVCAHSQVELKSKTERRLQEIAARVDGVVGYEMLDLTSGEKISRLEHETFPTA